MAAAGYPTQSLPPPPPPFAVASRSNSRAVSMSSANASFFLTSFPGGMSPQPQQGVIPASSFLADSSDPIDMILASNLASLDRAASSKLMLRRRGPGKYEIDGRKVTIRWTQQGKFTGLAVCEDEVTDSTAAEMPLSAYLSQAAHVAASLSGQRADMPKIARIPKERRLTFANASGTETSAALDQEGNERCESMR